MTRREKPVATPRLMREGWVPACPDRRVSSGMLIPRPEPTGRPMPREVPALYVADIGPAERVALREIAVNPMMRERVDLLSVPHRYDRRPNAALLETVGLLTNSDGISKF